MRKGFMLITVLAIMVVIAVGAAAVLKSVGVQSDLKSNNARDIQAQYTAEAAAQKALWRCRNSGACASGNVDIDGVAVPVTVTGSEVKAEVNYNNVQL